MQIKIFEYIAFSLLSPEYAVGQVERIEKEVMGLSQLPERFKLYGKRKWKRYGLRVMPVDNFRVFYMVNEEKKMVMVLRVLYKGQNMEAELQNDTKEMKH